MKKTLINLLAALVSASVALADEVTVANITIPLGGTGAVAISLENPDKIYTAGQMLLTLPEGVNALVRESGNPIIEKGERFNSTEHSFGSNLKSDGTSQFTIFSSQSEAIPSTSGTLFSTLVQVDEGLEIGEELQGTLSFIELSTVDAEKVTFPDVTFTISIGEPDDGRIKFDENALRLPTYTAGGKADVRMQRTIKAGNWSAIVLPFTLTKAKAEAAFGADVQLAEFSGFEVDYGEDEENVTPLGITVNFKTYTMNARKSMTGGKPFLIKTSRDIDSFEADEVTLFDAVTDVAQTDEFDTQGRFTGTLVRGTIPVNGIFLSGNKFWYAPEGQPTQAFRAWLELGAVLGQETDFGVKLAFAIDGLSTGIEGLGASTTTARAAYDLAGRKVSVPRRGIYVVDGKKVVVK